MAFLSVIICVAICAILLKRLTSGGVCKSKVSMEGRTVVITGANGGVGTATTLDLVTRGARVIMACRDVRKGKNAAQEIRKTIKKADIKVMKLDLASFKSIHEFCDELMRTEQFLHVLINNAGVFFHPETKTEDGFDTTFTVNYLGHFLLTNRLLKLLKKSSPSRIIVVSSWMHGQGKIDFDNLNGENCYDKYNIYTSSKLAVVLFARELHRQVEGTGISVYATHPGVVNTKAGQYLQESMSPVTRLVTVLIGKPLMWLLAKTPMQGAQTAIYCTVSEEVDGISGRYYADCKEIPYPKVKGVDEGVEKKLWEVSERMTGLSDGRK